MTPSQSSPFPQPDLPAESAADVAIVAKGGAIQVFGQLTHRSIAFLFTVVAVRVLGPAGFGLYQVVVQLLEFLGQLGLLGFNHAAMRYIARARVAGNFAAVKGTALVALLSTGIVSGVIVAVIVLAAHPIAGTFADSAGERERFAFLLRVGILYVPFFAFMQVLRYATQAYKTMIPSVVVGNMVQPVLRLAFGAVFLAAGFEVTGVIAGDVVSMGIAAIVSVYLFRQILTESEKSARAETKAGPIIRFALPQSGSALLGLQSLGLGIILLGLLASNEQAGLFAIALALQGPADLALSGVVNIWAPMVTDLHDQGAHERLDSLFKTITRWIATAALPISAALMIEPDLFARILGGESALEAAPVIAILAIGNVFHTCTGPSASVLSMTGRPGINFMDSLVGALLYALLGWAVIPRFGAIGMAWVHASITTLVNLVRVVQTKVLVGVQPFGTSLLKPVGATLGGAAVVLVTRSFVDDTIPLEIGGLALGSVTYLALLKFLGADEEERYVWSLMKKRLFRTRAHE